MSQAVAPQRAARDTRAKRPLGAARVSSRGSERLVDLKESQRGQAAPFGVLTHYAGWPHQSSYPAGTAITVLDPFGGAGTTGLVADRLGRNAVLIELSPDYAAMAERRITKDAGLFAEIAAE